MAERADVPRAPVRSGLGEIRGLTFLRGVTIIELACRLWRVPARCRCRFRLMIEFRRATVLLARTGLPRPSGRGPMIQKASFYQQLRPVIPIAFAIAPLIASAVSAFERHAGAVAIAPDKETLAACAKVVERQFKIQW